MLYSSSSEAYEAQYSVGSTGPNGGVVTSVVVDTALTNTQTEIVGGFEEKTEFYTHTETVIEAIDSTITTTVLETVETEVLTETTTSNTLCPSCDVSGSTSGGVNVGPNGYVFNYQGGTVEHTVDLLQYMNQPEFNRGFDLNASVDTLTCLNTIGSNLGCDDLGNPTADTLRLTMTVTDGTSVYTNTVTHTINWGPSSGFDTVYGSLAVPENNLAEYATATLSVYGIDNGFWGGYYGPYVTNPHMTFTYDAVSVILQEIERQVQETVTNYITTELLTDSSQLTRTYVGDPTDTVTAIPVEPVDVQIEATSPTTFEATITSTTPTGETKVDVIQVEVADLEIKELESFDGEVSADSPEASEEVSTEGGGAGSSGSQRPRSNNQSRTAGGSYSPVLESVKVAIMAQASADFAAYQSKELPSVAFYQPVAIDGGVNYDNPTGRWMTGASEVLWDSMVDQQWQK